jgi:hypothetical protein
MAPTLILFSVLLIRCNKDDDCDDQSGVSCSGIAANRAEAHLWSAVIAANSMEQNLRWKAHVAC